VSQPTPDVTAADVERIVQRDFPPEQVAAVLAALDEYGTQIGDGGVDRVRLAVLKLADRDLQKVRGWLEQAKSDYRDVLLAAEHPRYGKKWNPKKCATEGEWRQKMVDSDREQYERWLKK
jgi:hypothetical protein